MIQRIELVVFYLLCSGLIGIFPAFAEEVAPSRYIVAAIKKVDGEIVSFELGKSLGLRKGDKLTVCQLGKPFIYDEMGKKIAKLEVLSVGDEESEGKVVEYLDKQAIVKKGYWVLCHLPEGRKVEKEKYKIKVILRQVKDTPNAFVKLKKYVGYVALGDDKIFISVSDKKYEDKIVDLYRRSALFRARFIYVNPEGNEVVGSVPHHDSLLPPFNANVFKDTFAMLYDILLWGEAFDSNGRHVSMEIPPGPKVLHPFFKKPASPSPAPSPK